MAETTRETKPPEPPPKPTEVLPETMKWAVADPKPSTTVESQSEAFQRTERASRQEYDKAVSGMRESRSSRSADGGVQDTGERPTEERGAIRPDRAEQSDPPGGHEESGQSDGQGSDRSSSAVASADETDHKPSATPRADAMRARQPASIPSDRWNQWCDGVAYNEVRGPWYVERGGVNELYLKDKDGTGSFTIVDSYIPNEEIVSRKDSDLSEVKKETAAEYVRELDRKYSPGHVIADTRGNQAKLPGEIGKPIRGDMILEVPPPRGDIPEAVLKLATSRVILIRDHDGKYHNSINDEGET